ncbi:hypothetical protein ACWDA7_26055 [Streptomyces sp. NPDC001156]|jgi:hypothetical protein
MPTAIHAANRAGSSTTCPGRACYGYTGRMGDAEYDHLISLQLGRARLVSMAAEPGVHAGSSSGSPFSVR